MAEAEVSQGVEYVTAGDLEHLTEMNLDAWVIVIDLDAAKSYRLQVRQIIDSVTEGELDLDGGSFL